MTFKKEEQKNNNKKQTWVEEGPGIKYKIASLRPLLVVLSRNKIEEVIITYHSSSR